MSDESAKKSLEEKIKHWLKDYYNLGLVGVILLALIIRTYYFFQTAGQALWWDEAEYLALAKHWAFNVPIEYGPARPPLFQFMSAIAFMMGLGEQFIKFFFVVIPSTAIVGAVYLLGKEMFNKKIALIAAFLTTVSWTLVFWSSRQQPDFFSMFFSVLSIAFMWSYWKHPNRKHIILSGIFAALGLYFKVSALLVPMIFAVFMLAKDRLSAFRNKDYYIFSAAFLATLVPYMIWSKKTFGIWIPFAGTYSVNVGNDQVVWGWYTLDFLSRLTTSGVGFASAINALFTTPLKAVMVCIFLILFIAGLVKALRCVLYADVLLKDKKRWFDPRIFSLIAIGVIALFYIAYIKGAEDRWVFLWLPFLFLLIADILVDLEKYLSKYSIYLASGAIILILLIGGFAHLQAANRNIQGSLSSYGPLKEGGTWIKEHSQPGDSVASISYTQTAYYSERKIINFAHIRSSAEFDSWLRENKPAYLVHSGFEPIARDPVMAWLQTYFQSNQTMLVPVQAYYEDEARTRPILIIFEGKYG